MKRQFFVTHRILQIENHALQDRRATNAFSLKMFCPQESDYSYIYLKYNKLNCWSIKDRPSFLSRYCVSVVYDELHFHERYYIHLTLFIFFYLVSNDSRKRTSGKDTTLYSEGFRFKCQPVHSL